ncbi:transposase, MuDR, MULE transposase domain protein [Tanacetum coccineum]
MRPLLITDGAHLKGTYKGKNLVLVRMDGNNQIVPIATGVSQGETRESWTWFLLKFKECIGEVPNLAIITDRHPAIILACNTIFPNAFHGHVRKAPITQLMEWYRALLQKWYCARRNKYKDSDANTLSDWATHKVMDRMQKSAHWKVLEIEYGRLYQVDDRRRVHQVDLTFCTCTCRKWQLSSIPCGHVIAVSIKKGCTDCSHLALGWFRKTTLYSTYQDLVYPVGEPSSWVRPDGLQVVKPPNMNFRTSGRPKNTDRIKSQGEEPIQVRCSRCGVRGHNKTACHEPIANYQYKATYTNNYVRPQEYETTYNNMYGGSQGYEAAYTNFDNMFEQANINFGRQSQHPLPTTPFTFRKFNLGQSSQQTYSTWDSSSWDLVNLADPYMNLYCDNEQCFKKRL